MARTQRFEASAMPYFEAIYRTAYHLTHAPEPAEDLTQETFLRAYRAFGTLRGTNVRAWLFTILRHAFIDQCRWRQSHPEALDLADVEPWSSVGSSVATTDSAEAAWLNHLVDDDVQRAMATLPAEWRLTVLLADLEGFAYREIAEITQAPIGTMMSRLSRARKRLYRELREYARAAGYVVEGQR